TRECHVLRPRGYYEFLGCQTVIERKGSAVIRGTPYAVTIIVDGDHKRPIKVVECLHAVLVNERGNFGNGEFLTRVITTDALDKHAAMVSLVVFYRNEILSRRVLHCPTARSLPIKTEMQVVLHRRGTGFHGCTIII